ncbi:MAG TPA: murein biosynthesis integral membrane protein MurJ [Fimbriimonas sp.]
MSEETPSGSKSPNVARAGGIMLVSLLLSRILGLVREMVISGMFGPGADVDAFTLAFSLPDVLFFAIAGGALSSAFIPVFSEYLHTEREREAWHIFSVVTTVMSTVVVLFIVIAWIFAEPMTRLLAQGKGEELMPLIVHMTRILLPAQFAFFIGGLMFGTLYSRQVFAVPGLGPNVYNLGIIFGAAVLGHFFYPGVVGMAWGALAGATVGNLLIPWVVMRKLGSRFTPSFDVRHPGVKKVFILMAPVVLGLSLPGVYDLITRYFGSYYHDGVNSWLRFANQLMQAPLGVFGQSLAIAIFPALAQFYAQQKMDMYRMQLSSTLRTVLYLTLPVCALFFVGAEPIVAALFQHGEFTRTDTLAVAQLLRIFALGIWAWCMHPVLMRGFFAVQSSVVPIVLGTVTTVVFVLLVLALQGSMGYQALPAASSISAVFLATIMMLAVQRKVGKLDLKGIGATFAKSLLGSLLFAGATFGILSTPLGNLEGRGKLVSVLLLFLISVPGAWLYYFVTKWMGMPETKYVARAMDRINRRTRPISQAEAGGD